MFGPVLHVVRWRSGEINELLAQLSASGYALTLGTGPKAGEQVVTVNTASCGGSATLLAEEE